MAEPTASPAPNVMKPASLWAAEEEKVRGELELARVKVAAEVAKLTAETATAQEEATKARLIIRGGELDLEDKTREHREMLANDAFHHTYRFDTEVGRKSVDAAMRTMDIWHRTEKDRPMTLIFSSPGGDVISGMAFWDYLNELRDDGTYLTTVAQGYAASMAGILLQAGDERVIGRESYILIHQISAGMMGSFGDLEDRMGWIERVQGRVLDIFAKRAAVATGREASRVRKEFERNWTRKDWWLDSAEALKLGVVDKIR